MIREAAYYEKLDNERVICRLCPLECRLRPGKAGACRSRFNRDGRLVTDNYGELVSLAIDPIEKKPLYHFYPGSVILSTGPNCCNLGCRHCQNWSISQAKTRTFYMEPEALVAAAGREGSIGVAFTYTEPTTWFEYIMDTAPLLRQVGLKVVLVTNGFVSPEPLEKLLTVTDAMNVDLKAMSAAFYKKVCKGKLQPVLDNVRRIVESGVHLEITNLVIPQENDSEEELSQLVAFLVSISRLVPLHFSAYYPSYRMTHEATPVRTLLAARVLAQKSLAYVYLGNVATSEGSHTACPQCGSELIRRSGYRVEVSGLSHGRCTRCGFETGIVSE
jgi:pyruvate formate lyase activating enzyme